MPGEGTSPLHARQVSFAKLGTASFAARFTADTGPLDGFELIFVVVQIDVVVAGLTFGAIDPSEAEAAAQDAVDKATDTLAAQHWWPLIVPHLRRTWPGPAAWTARNTPCPWRAG